MPSNYTQNYSLNQWEADDQVVRTDFNADNAKIDAAIKAVDQRVDGLSASKADAAALSALTQTVNTKAAASALTALQTVVNGKGNCQVVYGQYTGNGLDVKTNPITLTFNKKPVLVLIADESSTVIASRGAQFGISVHRGSSSANILIWGEKSLSWTVDTTNGVNLNLAGTVYHYVAFLEA